MKIYTKTGDQGETQVYADEALRMRKDADVLECYGTLDELNAQLGLLVARVQPSVLHSKLEQIQKNLFQIGFAISAQTTLAEHDLEMLEHQIDELQNTLPAQTHFILPGGCENAAQAHVCRTLARRAERRLVALIEDYPVPPLCMKYVNRLSDYLFMVARHLNAEADVGDIEV